jgi:RNA polymerase sigma-70 factor (ECF subfamily)
MTGNKTWPVPYFARHILPFANDLIYKETRMVSASNDEMLASLAQRGDQDAFLELYNRYLNIVYNRVKSRIPAAYAEDVTQEVFIAVVRSLDKFEQRSRFSTWLYTIVNRQIADFYRKRSRRGENQLVNLDQAAQVASSPAYQHERGDEQALIQKALIDLPEHYQEVIFLRFADGLTFSEIADDRGQSLEAIKSLYRRAIQALRDKIGVVEHE